MAAGHILPGYGDQVKNLRRVQSASCFPLDSTTLKELERASRLSQHEFLQIKENARQLWSRRCPQETTYNTYFNDGQITEITQSRPTSSHRRHRPHPSQLFLTNKLHFIAGYHKPDATVGKSAYKIDASASPAVQEQRQEQCAKYQARPDSALANLYKDPYGFKNKFPPREAQAAEAWVKLADDADCDKVTEVLKKTENVKVLKHMNELRPKSVYPSLYRWMKLSGVEENAHISRIVDEDNSNSPRKYSSCNDELKYRVESPCKHCYCSNKHRLQRGEYLIHPDWKPSLPHHRIP